MKYVSKWASTAVLVVSVLAIAAWNGHHDRRIADQLRRDGVEVGAEIVELRERTKLGGTFGDEVKVVFAIDGQPYETWVVVAFDDTDLGPARIRYKRTDPSVARLITDMEPRSGALAFWLIFLTVGGALGWGIVAFVREMDRQLGLKP